jgi:hypothetical protein
MALRVQEAQVLLERGVSLTSPGDSAKNLRAAYGSLVSVVPSWLCGMALGIMDTVCSCSEERTL